MEIGFKSMNIQLTYSNVRYVTPLLVHKRKMAKNVPSQTCTSVLQIRGVYVHIRDSTGVAVTVSESSPSRVVKKHALNRTSALTEKL